MKYLVFLAIVCSSIFFQAKAQVKWIEETHNFGAFNEKDGTVSCDMKFVNIGNKPVIINQVHVTCGCTSPSFDKKPIAPGDTGYVTLAYNPTGRPGRFEKRVYVDMNTTPSRYTLYIKGSVVGSPTTLNERYPVEEGPLRLRTASAPFGEVLKGKSKSYFLEIYNSSTDTLIPKWKSIPNFLTTSTEEKPVFPGENSSFVFMLASEMVPEYGLTIDSLVLIPDDVKYRDPIVIPMSVMVQEDFSHLTPGQLKNAPVIEVSETIVNFEEIDPETLSVSRSIDISNQGKDQLIIHRVYSIDKGIVPEISTNKIKKGKTAQLTVTVHPEQLSSDVVNARVVIISNDPAEPMLSIRISGMLKK